MRKKIKKLLLSITVIGTAQLNFAQQPAYTEVSAGKQDTLKTLLLKEVIVTATRSEKNVADVGRSITVITSDDIKNSVYNNTAELLSQQEGIYIVGAGQNPGMLQNIYVRGANSNHTVIMIDGVRITDPSSADNAIDLSELSLTNIEKIEIVRGSHSTLYGSSAIGGIVNIITKKATKPGFNADAEMKTGTFGNGTMDITENVYLNYTAKTGLYASTEIYNTNVNGLDATLDTVTDPNVYKNRDKDGFDKLDVIGKLGFKNKKWDVFASYKITDQKTDIDDGSYKDDDNYTLDFNRNLLTYGFAYKINDKLKLKYNGGLSDMTRIAVDDSSVVNEMGDYDNAYFESTYKGSIFNNELQANLKLKGMDVVLGGGRYEETMTAKTYYLNTNTVWGYESESDLDSLDIRATTNNVFVHIDLNGSLLNEKFKAFDIAVGGRWNGHSTFGDHFTYELNPSYKVSSNALFYASYSTGFNAPPLYRLYAPDANYISGITRGNKNLKPETSVSYEFGLKQKINENTSIGIAWFYTVVDNVIAYAYLWDKNIGIDTLRSDTIRDDFRGDTYLNIGTQTNKGIEFSINSKLSDKLYVSGNLSLVSGKLNYNPIDIETEYTQGHHVQLFTTGAFLNKEVETLGLTRRPNTANVSITYKPVEKLKVRVDMRYAGARNDIYYESTLGPYGALGTISVEDYTLVDITIRYSFNKHLSATIRGGNIFNVKYQEINGYTTRGRSIYLKLRYTL